jgi:hypothetical protein
MPRKLTDIVNFGKHKGKTWGWVSLNDPRYIEWFYERVEGWSIEGLTLDEIVAASEPEWNIYEHG